jgi:hypothetical protein
MSFSNTSVLISQQVPEFIREEYPLFVDFIKAYYEFLEQEQFDGVTGVSLKNNLTTQLKDIRNVVDVDKSLDQFEDSFLNTFLSLVPKDTQVNKEFLVKNILPLYLSKGIDDSFKLLFKFLFDEEVEINLPKDNILRVSDGKWIIDNSLKIERDVRSVYTGNGSQKEFFLAQSIGFGEASVYINGILKQENVDYEIRKESKKIIFSTAPTNNSIIKIVYTNFDYSLFTNRKIIGVTTGASALVERAVEKIITDNLNFGLPYELFINSKTLSGTFINGEEIRTDIVDSNGNLITITADTFSILTSINVIDGGRSYNVGDPVLVLGGGPTEVAAAEVERVEDFDISRIVVDYGGAGFKNTESTYSGEYLGSTTIAGYIDGINTSHFTANSYTVLGVDQIEGYSNVTIDAADYGMTSALSENVTTRIVDALSKTIVTNLGPITNAFVIFSTKLADQGTVDAIQGALYEAGNTVYDIKAFKSIGRIDVISGGSNYKVGDEIIFTAQTGSFLIGTGAAAAVKKVGPSGEILLVDVQPPRVMGTVNIVNNSINISGTGTDFTAELQIGDKIVIRSQERYINSISSQVDATVNVAFSFDDGTTFANNYKMGSFAQGLVGGTNYSQELLPNVSVVSTAGVGGIIGITSLMSDGEVLRGVLDVLAGRILSIKLTSGGSGYQFIPKVDLSQIGDGKAVAEATLGSTLSTLPGRWTTTDSIISNSERRLQGSNYYFDFSYVTSSLVSFSKYKNILKDLLHPAGFVNYAVYTLIKETKDKESTVSFYSNTRTISGVVSTTNNSIYIIGTGTKFNIANQTGILTIGSNVAVNGQIRTISSFISNTSMTVSSAFTTNSNSQTLIIMT